jgi:hypothetical protein
MTDSDRERRCFRPSYDRKMAGSFSKEMLASADFREKNRDCRLVLVHILELCVH